MAPPRTNASQNNHFPLKHYREMCLEVANFSDSYRESKGNELYTPPASSKCSVVAWLATYANVDRSLLKTYSNIIDVIQALVEGKKLVLPGPDPNLAALGTPAVSRKRPAEASAHEYNLAHSVTPSPPTDKKITTRSAEATPARSSLGSDGNGVNGQEAEPIVAIKPLGSAAASANVLDFLQLVNLEISQLRQKSVESPAVKLQALVERVKRASPPIQPAEAALETLRIVLRVSEYETLEEDLPALASFVSVSTVSESLQRDLLRFCNGASDQKGDLHGSIVRRMSKSNNNARAILDAIRSARNQTNSTTTVQRILGLYGHLIAASRPFLLLGSSVKAICSPTQASRYEEQLFDSYETVIIPALKKYARSRAVHHYSDNHNIKVGNNSPGHGMPFFSSMDTIMNAVRPLGPGFPDKSNIAVPVVLPFNSEASKSSFEQAVAKLASDDITVGIFDRYSHFHEVCAEGSDVLPSLHDLIPLPQLFGNFGTFDKFKNEVMEALSDLFGKGNEEPPTVIFSCHDQQGDRAISKLQVLYLLEDGRLRDDVEGPDIGDIVQKNVQLIAAFHLQKALLEGLCYNKYDLTAWVAPLMVCAGERSKFIKHNRLDRQEVEEGSESEPSTSLADNPAAMLLSDDTPDESAQVSGASDDVECERREGEGDSVNEDDVAGGEQEGLWTQASSESDLNRVGDVGVTDGNEGDDILSQIDEGNEENDAIPLHDSSEGQLHSDAELYAFRRVLELVDKAQSEECEDKVRRLQEALALIKERDWSTENELPVVNVTDRIEKILEGGNANHERLLQETVTRNLEMLKGEQTISYTRLLHRCTIHWLAWEACRAQVVKRIQEDLSGIEGGESEESYLKRMCRGYPAIASLFAFFDRDLRLAVGVFRDLRSGKPLPFLNSLHKMTAHLCYYEKHKIASTVITFIDTLEDLKKRNPEVFQYVCRHLAALTADELQEFQNSRYSRVVNCATRRTQEYLQRKSVTQMFVTGIREVGAALTSKKKRADSPQTCELMRRHNVFHEARHRGSIEQIKRFILHQVALICEKKDCMNDLNAINKEKEGFRGGHNVFSEIKNTANVLQKLLPWKLVKMDELKEWCTALEGELARLKNFSDNGATFQPQTAKIRKKEGWEKRYLFYKKELKDELQRQKKQRSLGTSRSGRNRRITSRYIHHN